MTTEPRTEGQLSWFWMLGSDIAAEVIARAIATFRVLCSIDREASARPRRRMGRTEGKQKLAVSRTEAVDRIRALLVQLDKGSITVGDMTVAVPEQIQLKLEAEPDEVEFELQW